MCVFLEKVVVQNIVLGTSGENRSTGGIILPGPPQEPSMQELKSLSEEVAKQSAAKIHEELGASTSWTVNGFLMMCRRVVTETCQIKAQFRDWYIQPWFKGDPCPIPKSLHAQVKQIEKFD